MELFLKYPNEVQLEVLVGLLDNAVNTDFGKKHGFSDINSYKDFTEAVPLSKYEDLEHQIEEMRRGAENIFLANADSVVCQIQWHHQRQEQVYSRQRGVFGGLPLRSSQRLALHLSEQQPRFTTFYRQKFALGWQQTIVQRKRYGIWRFVGHFDRQHAHLGYHEQHTQQPRVFDG